MIYLVDTNVLLRILRRTDPYYPLVRVAVHTLWADGHQLQATHILTFNTKDFARYAPEGIVAVDPTAV